METQHHTKSTFLECTEPDYFRDVQVVLDCTGFYFFVSPILETIYTLTYSVISSSQVWLPDERWGTEATPPCPHCHSQSAVSCAYEFTAIQHSNIHIEFQHLTSDWSPWMEGKSLRSASHCSRHQLLHSLAKIHLSRMSTQGSAATPARGERCF